MNLLQFIGDSIVMETAETAMDLKAINPDLLRIDRISNYGGTYQSPKEWLTAGAVVDDFAALHRISDPISEIRSYYLNISEQYVAGFYQYFGNDTTKWPMRILMDIPSFGSERVSHATQPRVEIVNQMARDIFVKEKGWYLFPEQTITESIAYPGRGAHDGMHPDDIWRRDIFRVLCQLIVNTLEAKKADSSNT